MTGRPLKRTFFKEHSQADDLQLYFPSLLQALHCLSNIPERKVGISQLNPKFLPASQICSQKTNVKDGAFSKGPDSFKHTF